MDTLIAVVEDVEHIRALSASRPGWVFLRGGLGAVAFRIAHVRAVGCNPAEP